MLSGEEVAANDRYEGCRAIDILRDVPESVCAIQQPHHKFCYRRDTTGIGMTVPILNRNPTGKGQQSLACWPRRLLHLRKQVNPVVRQGNHVHVDLVRALGLVPVGSEQQSREVLINRDMGFSEVSGVCCRFITQGMVMS